MKIKAHLMWNLRLLEVAVSQLSRVNNEHAKKNACPIPGLEKCTTGLKEEIWIIPR